MPSKFVSRLAALALVGAALGCAADVATTPSVTPVASSAEGQTPASTYSFAVIGDMPYGQNKLDSLPLLLDLINKDDSVQMTIHVGDIKAGSKTPCTDAYFANVKGIFDQLKLPFVYTPGDNEWTDCHQPIKSNGVYTPTERLDAIRKLFFPVPGKTLGIKQRTVNTQGLQGSQYAAFVENVWFREAGVVFGTVNITGSNDDIAPWGTPLAPNAALWPTQAQERAVRLPANLRWIRTIFSNAAAIGARGVVIAFQADMWDPAEPTLVGFDEYVRVIGELAVKYGKPVLLLEGDSHVWRTDKPFTASSPFFAMHPNTPVAPNITRLVVSGSGSRTSYTRVTIDKTGANPKVFSLVEVPLQ